MSSLNLSWHSFMPFPHVLLLVPREQSTSSCTSLSQEVAESSEVTSQSSLLQSTTPVSSACPHRLHLPVLLPAWLGSSGHIQECQHHFYIVQTRTAHSIQGETCTNSKCIGRITTFNHMVTMCLTLPKMSFALLALLAARCWLMLSVLLPAPTDLFLLSRHLSPSLCLFPALFFSWCRTTQHFPLMNFTSLLISQCSHLFRSLYKASHPSRDSTASPSFKSSASLLRMHSTSAFRSLLKIWNRTVPRDTTSDHLPDRCSPIH